ncbi:MAG TPA: hypothetical protein VFM88_00400 [Vicinamibacteria bacterium]|nr:hypothetical protein [Vicinamibacteria bacterium]
MTARERGLLIGLGGVAWLLASTAAATRYVDYSRLGGYRRLWADMAVGITAYLDAAYPEGTAPAVGVKPDGDPHKVYENLLLARIRHERVGPWEFWRTVTPKPFLRRRVAPEPRAHDDQGRAVLLGLGFRALGGISPFLILWLGAFASVPVVFWTGWELSAVGHPIAGATLLGLLGLSPYFIGTLLLPRYTPGFYLIAVLLIVPLSAYAVLAPRVTLRGLLVRALLAAVGFAGAGLCRSTVGLLLPGFALALVLAGRRAAGSPWRRGAVVVGALLAFLLPYPAMKGAQAHDLWQPLWEGLGDFDREKGYTWSDQVAGAYARERGAEELWTAESEAVFRGSVLRDIRTDPGWYAAILARRLGATLSLRKLWPWRAPSGVPIALSRSTNEGGMDKYWMYAPTADRIGFGRNIPEVPVPVLVLPTLTLVLLSLAPWVGPACRRQAARRLAVLACPALACLPLPVLITTAGGQEPQAIAIVYLLGTALLFELALRAPLGHHVPAPTGRTNP